jgi:HPt (histidine-containing phosphotransfer) domain-containing protein
MDEVSLADELGDEFAELQKEFLDTTRARVHELVRLLAVAGGETPSGTDGETFRRIAHSVRGSGGSYGFDAISAVAGELEKAYLGGEATSRLAELVENLSATVAQIVETTLGTSGSIEIPATPETAG